MENILILLAITLGTVIGALIYRQGLKDGKPIAEGKTLRPIIKHKPSKPPKRSDFDIGINNILNYTGEEQKDEDDD